MLSMKIAIIGSGYAGLATAWFLLKKGHSVTLFSHKKIGDGASGASAGLLHPYPGRNARKAWNGDLALTAAKQLIQSVSFDAPCAQEMPFFRIPKDLDQRLQFDLCVEKHEEVKWKNNIPGVAAESAIHIPALVVDPQLYLPQLWKNCKAMGASYESHTISSLSELDSFDQIVVAAGKNTKDFFPQLDLRMVGGRAICLRLPKDDVPLFALGLGKYMVPTMTPGEIIIGASFERGEPMPIQQLREQLLSPLKKLFPVLEDAKEIGISEGVRVTTKNRLPMACRIDPRTVVLSGFGSRGLLYHAIYARDVSLLVLNQYVS